MILASGAFDGVHAGHVAYLEAAKGLCAKDELLVCAVAPDSYILNHKGHIPRWTQHERVRTVRALDPVDAAIGQAAPSVAGLIRDYRPRIFVKGPDWKNRLPEDVYAACEETGTSVAFVDTPGTHVSETANQDRADELALAQFESLVLNQKPAEKPWEPVTDYSFEARKEIEGWHPQLIVDAFQPARILDVGCGAGHLVILLRQLGMDAKGCDVGLSDLTRAGLFRASILADPIESEIDPGRDLVVCREVLEHLTVKQIRVAITNLCKLSSRFVYVTTRFAKQPEHFLSLDTSDDLDPTHITMLNQSFLRTLFVLEGFKRRADLEEKMDWQHKKRVLVYERT